MYLMARVMQMRATLPLMSLLMLLQRSPVVKFLAEARFAAPSRVVQWVQWATVSSVALGTNHALSGATRDISPAGPTFTNPLTVEAGAAVSWAARVDLSTNDADVWQLKAVSGHPFPTGLSMQIAGKNLGHITGVIQTPGLYRMEIIAWQNANFSGTRSLPYFLDLKVTAPPLGLDFVVDDWTENVETIGWIFGYPGDWAYSLNFGYVHVSRFPWVYVQNHGWMYFNLRNGDDMWLYSSTEGWAYRNITHGVGWLFFRDQGASGTWVNVVTGE